MLIIANDTGASGGVAWKGNRSLSCAALPEMGPKYQTLLSNIIKYEREEGEPVICYIEKPPSYIPRKNPAKIMLCECSRRISVPDNTGFPSSTMQKMGISYGDCRASWWARNVKPIDVAPRTWQKVNGAKRPYGTSQSKWKRMLKQIAIDSFPTLAEKKLITLKTSDALLILRYGIILANQDRF